MAFNAGGHRTDGGVFPAAPDVLVAIRDGAAMLLDGVREVVAPDPVFEAVRHQQALHRLSLAVPEENEKEMEAAIDREQAAWHRMLTIQPRTAAGLLALIRGLSLSAASHDGVPSTSTLLDLIGDSLSDLMGPATPASALDVEVE